MSETVTSLEDTPIVGGHFTVSVTLADGTPLHKLSHAVTSWSYSEEDVDSPFDLDVDENEESDYEQPAVDFHLQLDHLVTLGVLREIKENYGDTSDGVTSVVIQYFAPDDTHLYSHYFKGVAGFSTAIQAVADSVDPIIYNMVVLCTEVELHRLS